MVDRRRIETLHKGEFSAGGSFLKRHIFERIFKTSKCFLCQEKTHATKLLYCSEVKCQSCFCKDCIEDNFGKCYACMVIKKEITDQKSKLMVRRLVDNSLTFCFFQAPDEVDKRDNFLSYDEFLERVEHDKKA